MLKRFPHPSQFLYSTLILVFAVCFMTGQGRAQSVDYHLHWAPSPIIDSNGIVRPEAVAYEVYVRRGTFTEVWVATVPDTLYTLAAEPDLEQRVIVRAVDGQGRFSPMSAPSDPIYFASTGSQNGNVPLPPTVAALRPNYPNPFNPETSVVYGVPENATGQEKMRLAIYNVKGQLVRHLAVDPSPGWHETLWDGKDDRGVVSATGMYLTRFSVGAMVTTGKMTMVK